MNSLYRIAFLVLSVFALWSLILVGYAVENQTALSADDLKVYKTSNQRNLTHPPLDAVTTSYLLEDYKNRIVTNKSVVMLEEPVIELPETVEKVPQILLPDPTFEEGNKVIDEVEPTEPVESEVVPTSAYVLSVPFTSQAPEGNWGEPWQEACEEASLIMAAHYFKGTTISTATAIDEIYTLVEYQTDNGLNYHDSTMEQTGAMGAEIHGLISEVVDNPSVEDIENALTLGHLVIAPFAGRLLGNTHFSPPGPRYHVNVIIGFDKVKKEFIVNDPGTRLGQEYRYSYDTVMSAMHDWTGNAQTIESGAKRVLIVKDILREHSAD